jgi:hypothetical protein
MADINKTININVNAGGADNQLDNLSDKLDKVGSSTTKVTQSTNLHTKTLDGNKKSILENGGAMGILGAATGGLAMDFKDAVEAIEMTGISLKGLRGAIIATGIGALAILLLELITNWDKWSKVIDGSTAATEKLNKQIEETRIQYEQVAIARDASIAKAEAQGVSEAELHRQRMAQFAETKDKINEQIADKEALIAIEEKSFNTNEELVATTQKEIAQLEIDRLKNSVAANTEWQKEQFRIQDELINNQIKSDDERAASEKIRLEKSVAAQKAANQKILDERKRINDEVNKLNETLFTQGYSQLSQNLKLSNTLWYDNQNALAVFNKTLAQKQSDNAKVLLQIELDSKEKIAEVNKDINSREIINEDERAARIKLIIDDEKRLLEERNVAYRIETDALIKKNNINDRIANKFLDNSAIIRRFNRDSLAQVDIELARTNEQIKIEGKILALELERLNLTTEMFNFEKENGSLGLDNSNKFEEINKRINDQYDNRIKLINILADAEEERLAGEKESLENQLTYYNDLLIASQKLVDEKKKDVESGLLKKTDKEYVDSILKRSDLEIKTKDLTQKLQEKELEQTKSFSSKVLQINEEGANRDLAIFTNIWEKKRMLRDEALDREKLYYGGVMNIANESANFLDALISNGHMKDKKAAENALALRKVIGVANVVITGQEEIRGIWANPSLTALPDTGATAKALLTAAAVARAGLSIATILAQKLSGGGSGSASAGSVGPQANFNVVGSSSNNQLAATIAAQQQQPVKAYVVGSDVSTQQSLDRNIINNATFI